MCYVLCIMYVLWLYVLCMCYGLVYLARILLTVHWVSE